MDLVIDARLQSNKSERNGELQQIWETVQNMNNYTNIFLSLSSSSSCSWRVRRVSCSL